MLSAQYHLKALRGPHPKNQHKIKLQNDREIKINFRLIQNGKQTGNVFTSKQRNRLSQSLQATSIKAKQIMHIIKPTQQPTTSLNDTPSKTSYFGRKASSTYLQSRDKTLRQSPASPGERDALNDKQGTLYRQHELLRTGYEHPVKVAIPDKM